MDMNKSVKLLKLSVLYGHNASGKTNLFLALDFLRTLVIDGQETKDKEIGFIPFKFDEETLKLPGEFSLIFYINKIKYHYQVVLNNQHIHSETLDFWPEGRKASIFNRTGDSAKQISRITFGLKAELSADDKNFIVGNTLENNTVLYAYQRTNVANEVLNGVVTYFRTTLLPLIGPNTLLRHWSMSQTLKNGEDKEILLQLIRKADFQITAFEVKKIVEPVDEKDFEEIERNELYFSHETPKGSFKLASTEESEGTQRYYRIGGVLRKLITSAHVASIDELETSLHPDLVTFLLKVFLTNSQDSQIIATTHAQYLMELDYMRRDMIWFCEKADDGSSQYFSAQEFKIHKNIRLDNYYRIGKLGAKPSLGTPFLEGN